MVGLGVAVMKTRGLGTGARCEGAERMPEAVKRGERGGCAGEIVEWMHQTTAIN